MLNNYCAHAFARLSFLLGLLMNSNVREETVIMLSKLNPSSIQLSYAVRLWLWNRRANKLIRLCCQKTVVETKKIIAAGGL